MANPISPLSSALSPQVGQPQAPPQDLIEKYMQASRPNPMQAIGNAMSGFAAPFLGQNWQPPENELGDLSMWLLKQKLSEQMDKPSELSIDQEARRLATAQLGMYASVTPEQFLPIYKQTREALRAKYGYTDSATKSTAKSTQDTPDIDSDPYTINY